MYKFKANIKKDLEWVKRRREQEEYDSMIKYLKFTGKIK